MAKKSLEMLVFSSEHQQQTSEISHDLNEFMAQVSKEIEAEYSRIVASALEDPGTAGDEGEETWAALLRKWLPPNYHVMTKGRLIGYDGRKSPQIDIVVLKPFYPERLREKRIWLADGVAAAFECKLTLRSQHIDDSARRCAQFKGLFKPRTGSPRRELRSPLIYGLLAHSHAWKSANSKPENNVTRAVEKANKRAAHPVDLIDMICVADVGTWSTMLVGWYQSMWSPVIQKEFGDTWLAATTMNAAVNSAEQVTAFRPFGGLVGYLTQRLAMNDSSLRDLADYYRLARMWGSGSGKMQFWRNDVYSEETRKHIEDGWLKNDGDVWNEWNIAC